jgi:hypothetical protein
MSEEKEKKVISDSQRLEQVELLVAENSELLKELKKEAVFIRRYVKTRTIIAFFWLILIILPAIFAFIYLPSYLKNYLDPILEFYNKI